MGFERPNFHMVGQSYCPTLWKPDYVFEKLRGIFQVETLCQKFWPLLFKRAELNLRSTKYIIVKMTKYVAHILAITARYLIKFHRLGPSTKTRAPKWILPTVSKLFSLCCELTLTHDVMQMRGTWSRPAFLFLSSHWDEMWGSWDWSCLFPIPRKLNNSWMAAE